ncbi:MAG TPA: hypothetical protein DHV37_05895 [Erysipelotrichaceae bacterium]|nr:hypothetical protein [Erysipelotrichaceae bacterium]
MTIEKVNEIMKKFDEVGVPVEQTVVEKNGVKKHCIIVGEDGNQARPIFYLDEMEVDDVDEFVNHALNCIKGGEIKMKEVSENIGNFDWVKDKLRICVGKEVSEDAVQRKFMDVIQYVRIVFEDGSAIVKRPLLDMWDISEEELFSYAYTNMEFRVRPMSEVIKEIMVIDDDDMPGFDGEDTIYVMSTMDYYHGASAMCCTRLLDDLAEQFDDDLLILPSSIHEVIATKFSQFDPCMYGMVKEVNESQVAPEERLSDNVYKYSREEHCLSIAS